MNFQNERSIQQCLWDGSPQCLLSTLPHPLPLTLQRRCFPESYPPRVSKIGSIMPMDILPDAEAGKEVITLWDSCKVCVVAFQRILPIPLLLTDGHTDTPWSPKSTASISETEAW